MCRQIAEEEEKHDKHMDKQKEKSWTSRSWWEAHKRQRRKEKDRQTQKEMFDLRYLQRFVFQHYLRVAGPFIPKKNLALFHLIRNRNQKRNVFLRQQNRSDKYAQNELYDFKIQNTIQYIATFIQNC